MSTRCAWLLVAAVVAACSSSPAPGMTDAKTAQQDIDAALRDTPLPPGASIAVTVPDQNGSYETGYGQVAVQGPAMCKWFEFWLTAIATDRTADITLARNVAAQFPSWEIYRRGDVSFKTLIDTVVANANLGDPGAMSQFVSANCGS